MGWCIIQSENTHNFLIVAHMRVFKNYCYFEEKDRKLMFHRLLIFLEMGSTAENVGIKKNKKKKIIAPSC